MHLIRAVHVEGFRSLKEVHVVLGGPLSAMVGRNSTGKSNLLRSLNLFFNNEVEPMQRLDFSRDYFAGTRRGKKTVAVQVDFNLPDYFTIHRSIRAAKDALGRDFSIRRVWFLDARRRVADRFEVFRDGERAEDADQYAESFTSLVRYRYVPNVTVPASVLQEEGQALARSLSKRVRARVPVEGLLKVLDEAGMKLLSEAGKALERSHAPLTNPTMSTPDALGGLITVAGFEAQGQHGTVVRDDAWGIGHQTSFLFDVLCAVDTDYRSSFGWRQATVWGVEEPESGLHYDLEILVAESLRTWCEDKRRRLQAILTTHSATFAMAAHAGHRVTLEEGETKLEPEDIPLLVQKAELGGVISWTQPLLAYPFNPIVLVEGPIDAKVLRHIAVLMGRADIRFIALPQLDPAEKGAGRDSIITYLSRHGALVANRPSSSPLLVLLDWDTSDADLDKARGAYGSRGSERVLRAETAYCDPKLGRDFRGIERFYPLGVIEDAILAGELAATRNREGVLTVSRVELRRAKSVLVERIKLIADISTLRGLGELFKDLTEALQLAITGRVQSRLRPRER